MHIFEFIFISPHSKFLWTDFNFVVHFVTILKINNLFVLRHQMLFSIKNIFLETCFDLLHHHQFERIYKNIFSKHSQTLDILGIIQSQQLKNIFKKGFV